jgi:hypothetical protein
MFLRTPSLLVLLGIIAGGSGCVVGPDTSQSRGPLGLELMAAFRKAGSQRLGAASPLKVLAPLGADQEIDLEDIRYGRDYYFAVTNSGDADIRDVRVSIEAPTGFSVEPKQIALVPPGIDADVLPLVRLSVSHGVSPTSEAAADLLEPGQQFIDIQLEGRTSGETVTYTGQVRLFALVTEISLVDSLGAIDLAKSDGFIISAGSEAGVARMFSRIGEVAVINTGNTPIDVTFTPDRAEGPSQEKVLGPEQSITVPSGVAGYIRVGRGSAARDSRKLPLAQNGFSYLYLRSGR